MNGHSSDYIEVSSGVPQGSHLGPLFFDIYINDVRDVILYSHLLLFADDNKLYKLIKETSDRFLLQSDINALADWCEKNDLELNIEKCKILSFSRKREFTQYTYCIRGSKLEHVDSFRDLGVMMDRSMSFKYQIDDVINKCNRKVGFIIRFTKDFKETRSLVILYIALVRSLMDYASVIWTPQYQHSKIRLERVQKRMVKYLCYKMHINYENSNYEDLLRYFGLNEICQRHRFLDMCFGFKVLNGLTNCPEILEQFGIQGSKYSVRSHELFHVMPHKTNYGMHSPTIRISKELNEYPQLDIFTLSFKKFKNILLSLML